MAKHLMDHRRTSKAGRLLHFVAIARAARATWHRSEAITGSICAGCAVLPDCARAVGLAAAKKVKVRNECAPYALVTGPFFRIRSRCVASAAPTSKL